MQQQSKLASCDSVMPVMMPSTTPAANCCLHVGCQCDDPRQIPSVQMQYLGCFPLHLVNALPCPMSQLHQNLLLPFCEPSCHDLHA